MEAKAMKNQTSSTKRSINKKSEDTYVVKGIVHTDSAPLKRVLVKAFDQDVAREDLLGETTTDQEGHYAIAYTTAQFRRTTKEVGGPDLIVHVYDAEGQIIAKSKRKRNARAEEIIDLIAKITEPKTYQVSGKVASRVSA